jgi:predicted transposase YdaD
MRVMAKRFDAALKELITRHPYDWARQVGLPEDVRLSVADSELSTVTAAADRIIRVEAPHPCLLDIELMASHDLGIEARLLSYHALLLRQYGLPVHTALVLLRSEANSPNFSGSQTWRSPYGASCATIQYDLIRLWELPVEDILRGGPGILPLAPLAKGAERVLPDIVKELDRRFNVEFPPAEAAEMWSATYTLMGLRFPPEIASTLLRGVRQMRESSTYQAILEEGRQEGRQEGLELGIAKLRNVLLRQGMHRFGPPSAKTLKRLEAESGVERLEELAERLLDVDSWDELLG